MESGTMFNLHKCIFGVMKKAGLLFFVVFLSAWVGCTTKRLAVQVLKSAEITLPRDVVRVGVANRTNLAWLSDPPVYEKGIKTSRFRDLKQVGPKKVVEGFIVELGGFNRFVTVPVNTPEVVDSNATQIFSAKTDVLETIKKDYNVDVLVSLEDYKVDLLTEGNIYSNAYYDGFGNTIIVPRFQGRRTIKVTAFWRVYNMKNFTVSFERSVETVLAFASNGYNSDESYRRLPEQNGSVENTSQIAGIDFAKMYVPYWQDTERMIYVGQSNKWLDAADSAEVGNWASAAEQWKLLSKKAGLPIIQKQAIFNLYTAYEVLGNFDEAEYWAKLGKRKFSDKDFSAALFFLDKRRVENLRLDEQLNE